MSPICNSDTSWIPFDIFPKGWYSVYDELSSRIAYLLLVMDLNTSIRLTVRPEDAKKSRTEMKLER